MSIIWSPWSADAFARARADDRPVLLSISAVWCRWCREMDQTSYADPSVQALVNDRFVAVRVDADKRPDISERYALGGLPTTAFLTPAGDLLGGGTFVPLERMPAVLDQVARAYSSRRDEIAARAGLVDAAPSLDRDDGTAAFPALLSAVFAAYDEEYGGFGMTPKFPLAAPLHLALRLHAAAPDPSLRSLVEHSLDAMAGGGLYDPIDGGFFRCAAARDWSSPRQEKLLDVNAGMLQLYVEAADVLASDGHRRQAADVLRYLQTWLADPVDGGWAASQQADPAYYAIDTPEGRADAGAPSVDRTLYAGWNARMVSAALKAAQLLDEPSLAEFAIKSLERVLLACYQPGAGVAHYFDDAPQVRGLLDDQISMATAALDAAEATGDVTYEMMAEELAYYAMRTMWDEEHGGFFDRLPPDDHDGVGLLRRRVKPFVSNSEAARMLVRLAAASGSHELRAAAEAALAGVAGVAPSQGPLAAHYLLAMREAGLR